MYFEKPYLPSSMVFGTTLGLHTGDVELTLMRETKKQPGRPAWEGRDEVERSADGRGEKGGWARMGWVGGSLNRNVQRTGYKLVTHRLNSAWRCVLLTLRVVRII